ncbi:hypothetical protein AB1N83_003952 [Pleurotus pulmonarius]
MRCFLPSPVFEGSTGARIEAARSERARIIMFTSWLGALMPNGLNKYEGQPALRATKACVNFRLTHSFYTQGPELERI